jgi:hypothetical protein
MGSAFFVKSRRPERQWSQNPCSSLCYRPENDAALAPTGGSSAHVPCRIATPHLARPTASLSHSQGSCFGRCRPTSPRNNVFPLIKKSKRPGTPYATAMTRPAEVSPQPNPAELFERRVIIVFPPHADGPAFGFSKGGPGRFGCPTPKAAAHHSTWPAKEAGLTATKTPISIAVH